MHPMPCRKLAFKQARPAAASGGMHFSGAVGNVLNINTSDSGAMDAALQRFLGAAGSKPKKKRKPKSDEVKKEEEKKDGSDKGPPSAPAPSASAAS